MSDTSSAPAAHRRSTAWPIDFAAGVVEIGFQNDDRFGSRRCVCVLVLAARSPKRPRRRAAAGYSAAESLFGRRRSRCARPSSPAAGRSRSASAATIAAPVGVVSSPSTSSAASGTPRSSSPVAGAGIEQRPWAISTKPWPVGTGEQTTRSTPSKSKPIAEPTMSAIESTAPTSWKWTFSIVLPCTFASASASFWKIRLASSFCRAVSVLPSIIAVMWCRWRCLCSGSCSTVICVARKPFFFTSRADESAAGQAQANRCRLESRRVRRRHRRARRASCRR